MQILFTHHVGLTVSNMERSVDFYCNILGMKLIVQREITTPWVGAVNAVPGAHLKVAFLEAYGHKLELIEFTQKAGLSLPLQANRPGNIHLTYLVDDVDTAYQELLAKGQRFVAPPQTNTEGPNQGSKVVFLLDPDNIRIELVQAPPGQRQSP